MPRSVPMRPARWHRSARKPKQPVPSLIAGLKDKDANVRLAMTEGLSALGLEVLPALSEALKDDDASVRRYVTIALLRIDRDALAKDPIDAEVTGRPARAAILALGTRAVPMLVEALQDKEAGASALAARDLEQLGPEARAAIPPLIQMLKDDRAVNYLAAAEALRGIGPDALPALHETLKEKNIRVRRLTVHVLGRMRLDTKSAIAALLPALQDENEVIARKAARACAGSGRKPYPHWSRHWTVRILASAPELLLV